MSSLAPTVTLTDTAVLHMSAGRKDPLLPAPCYLLLVPDHPPPCCPRGRAAAWSGTPLKRSLERGAAAVMAVRSSDQACGQYCWGRGTHRGRAEWGEGLRTHPAPLGQTLSQRGSQSCPRTAPSLPPQVSHRGAGTGREGLSPAGRGRTGGEEAPLLGPGPGCSPYSPHSPSTAGTMGQGTAGGQPWVGGEGEEPGRCAPREKPTPT